MTRSTWLMTAITLYLPVLPVASSYASTQSPTPTSLMASSPSGVATAVPTLKLLVQSLVPPQLPP